MVTTLFLNQFENLNFILVKASLMR
uniref:Uncharacterized protein n=1 Tax=Arabidopsis thaliana TaxID=3702 RepID=Q56YG5_ARATH|nr:hypothetical protein [Arabidopsis thaliana]